MALALTGMITNNGAEQGHGIVLEQHLASFPDFVLLEQGYNLWNWCVDGASLHTQGFLAVEASICLG